MVPIMLLGKPLYKKFSGGSARRRNYQQMPDELLGDDEGNVVPDHQVVSLSPHYQKVLRLSGNIEDPIEHCC